MRAHEEVKTSLDNPLELKLKLARPPTAAEYYRVLQSIAEYCRVLLELEELKLARPPTAAALAESLTPPRKYGRLSKALKLAIQRIAM